MVKKEQESIVYHSDTSSFGIQVNDFNICFTWQELLEELSKKDIDVYIDTEKVDTTYTNLPIL